MVKCFEDAAFAWCLFRGKELDGLEVKGGFGIFSPVSRQTVREREKRDL